MIFDCSKIDVLMVYMFCQMNLVQQNAYFNVTCMLYLAQNTYLPFIIDWNW